MELNLTSRTSIECKTNITRTSPRRAKGSSDPKISTEPEMKETTSAALPPRPIRYQPAAKGHSLKCQEWIKSTCPIFIAESALTSIPWSLAMLYAVAGAIGYDEKDIINSSSTSNGRLLSNERLPSQPVENDAA
jgi:hypothetical protein